MAKPKLRPPFSFPGKPHRRKHGPSGHKAYQAYKPWLRDEFEFRCVYCLTRERWHGGHGGFTIDHVKPKSSHKDLECEYDNLVYACSTCNTLKSTRWQGVPDPCRSALGRHLSYRSGRFLPKTETGKRLIRYLDLNRPARVDFRNGFALLFQMLNRLPKGLSSRFGYPLELPDLSGRNPPGGNRRPGGVAQSHFARHKAGLLPPHY